MNAAVVREESLKDSVVKAAARLELVMPSSIFKDSVVKAAVVRNRRLLGAMLTAEPLVQN